MAEVVQEPQLRYTPDTQVPIAEMLVQFPAQREEDPPYTLKVIGWGNLGQEIHDRCKQGTQLVIEGRLSMVTVERKPEGFKEKRAELTAQKVHYLGSNDNFKTNVTSSTPVSRATNPPRSTSQPVATETYIPPAPTSAPPATKTPAKVATISPVEEEEEEPMTSYSSSSYTSQPTVANPADVDDIPF